MAYKKLKSVRLDEDIVNLVKEHKRETYIPIGVFFEKAAREKLEREKPSANPTDNSQTVKN